MRNSIRIQLIFVAILSCLSFTSGALAQSDPQLFWTKISGPWDSSFDGSFGAIAVHPTNPNIILIGSSVLGPGLFKSIDGGITWSAKNSGFQPNPLTGAHYPVSKIVFSVSNPNVIYLGTEEDFLNAGHIYKSTDGGESWQKVDGQWNIFDFQISGAVDDLDVNPQNPDIVYAGVAATGILKTTDGGTNWSVVYTRLPNVNLMDHYVVRIMPTQPETVFFTGYYKNLVNLFDIDGLAGSIPMSLFKSTNGGNNWTPITISWPPVPLLGNPPGLITDFQFERASGDFYFSTIHYQSVVGFLWGDRGIYKSTDAGQNWQPVNQASFGSLDQMPFVALTANPSAVNKGVFASTGLGGSLVASTDTGSQWVRLDPCLLNAYIGKTALAGNKFLVLTSLGIYFTDVSSLYAPATPTISSISPATLPTSSSPQLITINGSNFLPAGDPSASTLVFYDPANTAYPRTPINVTATSMQYNLTVLSVTGSWKVKVVNGALESLPFTFTVASSGVQLTGFSISGPSAIPENNSGQFTATAFFSDGTSSTVTSSTSWSENSSATSISSSGLLSAGSVSSDTAITVSASYTFNGVTKSANANVTVVNSGGGGSTTIHPLVNGTFESGTSPWSPSGYADVVALSYPHSGSWYAYLCNANNADGSIWQFFAIPAGTTSATIQFYLNVVSSETSTTTAYDTMSVSLGTANEQYVGQIAQFSNLDKGANVNGNYVLKRYDITSLISAYKGQGLLLSFSGHTDTNLSTIFRIDDVDITLTVNNPVALTGLSIRGPSSIPEGRADGFWADAIFSDGTTQTISPNSWSENSPVTTIDSSGVLTAGSVSSDTPVTVTASYTFNGVTQQATKNVTIIDTNVTHTLSSLALSGPSSMNENSSGQFAAIAIFSDGSSQAVTPSWSENSSATSISSSGWLTAGDVGSDTTITVSASYTTGGVTRNASQNVLILNIPTPSTLASLAISGPSSMSESSAAQYTAVASFSDGSSRVVDPTWNEDSAASSISISGLFSASEVTSDTPVTIAASFTTGGITRNAQKNVTIINTILTQAKIISLGGNLQFGNVATGSVAQSTLTISNVGNAAMTISNIIYPSGFSGNWSGTITPSNSQNVTVTFSPVSVTSYNGNITIVSDKTSGVSTIAASGTGTTNSHIPTGSTVIAWGWNGPTGWNGLGPTNVPVAMTDVVAVAAGGGHSMALKTDGTVVAWGDNYQGQTNVPAGLGGVVAIVAAGDDSLALKADGTVVVWGYNGNGELNVPADLTNAVAIAGGYGHLLAIRADRTLTKWGANYDMWSVPLGLSNVLQIAAGGNHNMALTMNGTVAAWGYNGFNETTIPDGLTNVVAIAAGDYHSLALRADKTIVAWGAGVTNSGLWPDYGQSIVPSAATNVVAISANGFTSLALREDGTVVEWGRGNDGSTNVPPDLTNIVGIAVGGAHSLVIIDNGMIQPRLWRPVIKAGIFTANVPTVQRMIYGMEYQNSLNSSNWTLMRLVGGNGSIRIFSDSSDAAQTRFYRALTMPVPSGMAWIPPGTFQMGSPTNEADRCPCETQHGVTLTSGFFMGQNLVTQGDFLSLMNTNPSYFTSRNGFGEDLNRPVDGVSWFDATNYCARLTEHERACGRLPAGCAYRLPTEAEWEYACRAGTTTAFYFGNAIHGGMANFFCYNEYDASVGDIYVANPTGWVGLTTPVGSYQPNPWGLYDMVGNVREWCKDFFYDYPASNVTDPQGPALGGGSRVLRSAAQNDNGNAGRSASRSFAPPSMGNGYLLGFRVVLAPSLP